MKRFSDDFPFQLMGLDFQTLEDSKHSIYGVDKDLNLIYINPAWMKFAEENGSASDVLKKYPLGSPMINAIGGKKVKKHYLMNYFKALQTGVVWQHEYECSAEKIYRKFHQGVYPLKDGNGLVIINSLMVERPIKGEKKMTYDGIQIYNQPDGTITQCSNCRHCQRSDNSLEWDWVPEYVRNMPQNVSHSICPTCFDYFWKYSRMPFKKV